MSLIDSARDFLELQFIRSMHARAARRGYRAGYAGKEASAPYLDIPIARSLIESYMGGYSAGLRKFQLWRACPMRPPPEATTWRRGRFAAIDSET